MIEITMSVNDNNQVVFEATRTNPDGVAAQVQIITDPTRRFLNRITNCAERAVILETIAQIDKFAAVVLNDGE